MKDSSDYYKEPDLREIKLCYILGLPLPDEKKKPDTPPENLESILGNTDISKTLAVLSKEDRAKFVYGLILALERGDSPSARKLFKANVPEEYLREASEVFKFSRKCVTEEMVKESPQYRRLVREWENSEWQRPTYEEQAAARVALRGLKQTKGNNLASCFEKAKLTVKDFSLTRLAQEVAPDLVRSALEKEKECFERPLAGYQHLKIQKVLGLLYADDWEKSRQEWPYPTEGVPPELIRRHTQTRKERHLEDVSDLAFGFVTDLHRLVAGNNYNYSEYGGEWGLVYYPFYLKKIIEKVQEEFHFDEAKTQKLKKLASELNIQTTRSKMETAQQQGDYASAARYAKELNPNGEEAKLLQQTAVLAEKLGIHF